MTRRGRMETASTISTILVAAIYVVCACLVTPVAEALWWEFGVTILLLTGANTFLERRRR